MSRQHIFSANIQWTGNLGTGTSAYTEYSRNHTLSAEGTDAGVIVTAYTDNPQGTLVIDSNGIGKFTEITLHPVVSFQNQVDELQLSKLHEKAHKHCFIANSLSCKVNIA